ncbi:Phospholipase/carboxylesterase family protein [Caenispirillum salinarum AK4]|uniref:Phospholipase/carboxylesterase family protein n=1 Tax=Caenispirillum salinarum AK4 TaxID=1238182 RepID=K9H6P1_9PROT|nr:prolyl oligopeptidase family serine peptidase [Caenispirillum salinarum]EKV32709.1 Phospholipase/carboxylesterase family protein [Caenispirillum salinarum AK4]
MTAATLSGPSHAPANGAPARRVVVFLHGYGADGNDLIGLAPFFGQAMPDAAFHSPHAPEPCEMAPMGRQWFSLRAYDPDMLRRDPSTLGPALEQMFLGAEKAAPTLDAYLDGLLEHYGLTPDKLVLAGFSQGTMMALHVGLRRATDRAPAAILGYSGALLGPDRLGDEIKAQPPVMLIHGTADEVVPPQAMDAAQEALRVVGVPVETHRRPNLPHGIDEDGAAMGRAFLDSHTKAAG